jgi:hypothetical protein
MDQIESWKDRGKWDSARHSPTAQVVATDNDFNLEDPGAGPGADSFGWRATGTVITVTGAELHYLAVFREIILPSGERPFPIEQIKLTPQDK